MLESKPGSRASSLSRSRSHSHSTMADASTSQKMASREFDEKDSFQKDVEAGDQDSDIIDDLSPEEVEGREDLQREGTLEEVRFDTRVQRDVTAATAKLERTRSARSARDPNLVTWDGPDDPANPKNWTMHHKWAATIIVSLFTFISPVASSVVAPALSTMAKDLHVSNDVEMQLMLSIFVLAYAVGPLFLGPLSEVYGRIPVLQIANLFYLCWNLGCGFAQTKTQMFVFRFLSGLGGSAPLAIGGGLLSDCWKAEERGKAIATYSLAPLLGPAIGPIAGGFITENTTWRWAFWATSMACGLIQVAGLFFLQETYAPKLLKRKADKLRKETGNLKLHTEFESPDHSLANIISRALVRPFRLLGTQPIVQVLAVYMAFIYGLMYIVLSTFPVLWTERYHESIGIGSLNYIALGAGFFCGTQISAPINDGIYRRLKRKNNNIGKPEFRVPLLVPGSILIPIGLFWYGWSAQAHTHWILPNIGAFFLCAGMIVCFQGLQTYIVDSYTRYAASAISAATVLRSLAGFGFPLFAPYMYAKLDYGWGNSLLAFIAIALGFPAPFLLWKYGELLRSKSRYAAG